MNLCEQGRNNQKIYIADTQGQLIVQKDLFFRKQHNILQKKTFKVKNLTGIQIFNAEIFIQNSQKINNLINANKCKQNNYLQRIDQQKIDQNRQFHTKKNSKINKLISNFQQQNNQNTNEKKQSYLKQTCKKQILLGNTKKSFLKFYNIPFDFSNFTVNNQSAAYFTIYSIDLQKFIQLQLPERLKNNFLKRQQQIIVSCLSRSIQKLNQFQSIFISDKLKINQFQQYAILAGFELKNQKKNIYSNSQNNKSRQQEQHQIQISLSKLQFYNKQNYEGIKINPIALRQSQNIQTKISLIKNNQQQKLNKQKVSQNYKQKIQTLIAQNLKIINPNNNNVDLSMSPNISKNGQNNYKQISNIYKTIVSQVFMQPKHQQNNNVFKNNQILTKNEHILTKQINKQQRTPIRKQSLFNNKKQIKNEILMQKDFFDPLLNQFMKINLIKKGHPNFQKIKIIQKVYKYHNLQI